MLLRRKDKSYSPKSIELIVADIDNRNYKELVGYGISLSEDNCWQKDERKKEGFLKVISEGGITYTETPEINEILIDCSITNGTLEGYFEQFIAQVLDFRTKSEAPAQANKILIINFMPFYLSVTRLNKIMQGIYSSTRHTEIKQFTSVIFLIRNIDWLTKSTTFQSIRENKLCGETWAIDIRCYGVKYLLDGNISNFTPSREVFRSLLNIDDNHIYNSLVFKTNSYIGHFDVGSSHVRTHYNLTEFIRRDDVWEYLNKSFEDIVGSAHTILLLGVGMEHGVLQKIGEHLTTLLDQKMVVKFVNQPTASPESVITTAWCEDHDMAIVVTDIVNTGNTLKPWINELNKKNNKQRLIKAFAVATMKNSNQNIEGVAIHSGIKIKRDYYSSNPDKCPLCLLSQPIKQVKKVEDFIYVDKCQLTPFDFWELVKDSNALKINAKDHQGRIFKYRVDTTSLIARYGCWLGNVVRVKFKNMWPNTRPDIICTVEESTGETFANLVAKALEIESIVKIPRNNLNKITSSGGLPSDIINPFSKDDRILIVDDGINFGKTIYKLIEYCRAADIIPIGVMVIDSRLNTEQTKVIRARMSRNHLVALYNWPAAYSEVL